jgi:hypothetical protein
MNRAPVATLQTIWDCRWSRPGHRFTGLAGDEQPEAIWVCVRKPGERRAVTDEECASCEFWEGEDLPKQ